MAKLQPSTPLFILLYGFPGAGKTFFARQLCEQIQAAHVQADRIRYELFDEPHHDKPENDVITQLTNYMASEFLQAGVSVVYDVNAMRLSQRRALRDLARRAHAEPLLVWLQIDTDSALSRSLKRDRRRMDDKYSQPITRDYFKKVIANSQNPDNTEDYIVVSGKHVFSSQFNAVIKKLHELNLISGEEAMGKVVKPGMVNLVPSQKPGRVDMSRRNITIR